jgi:HEPN domain-containing protein
MSTPEHWLIYAREDLRAARVLYAEQLFNQVCFHAQQCIEKLLKGFLLKHENRHPKTHDLLELLERATTHDPSLATWRDTLLVLNQFYIPVRYPDVLPGAVADGLPDAQESQQALQSAEAVFQALEPLLYSQAE